MNVSYSLSCCLFVWQSDMNKMHFKCHLFHSTLQVSLGCNLIKIIHIILTQVSLDHLIALLTFNHFQIPLVPIMFPVWNFVIYDRKVKLNVSILLSTLSCQYRKIKKLTIFSYSMGANTIFFQQKNQHTYQLLAEWCNINLLLLFYIISNNKS